MLDVTRAVVRFGSTVAVDGVDLSVGDGEVLALLGPSGSGKTTLLRAVAGFQALDSGTITWDDQDLANLPPHLRRFGLVFQDFALFPHLDVGGNVGFGLRMQGVGPKERERLVEAALESVELPGMQDRRIATLSGGQQQRVALARQLAAEPRMLLLDEPLGSLDRALRERLTTDLRSVLARPGITALYVTHDQMEAFAVADRIAIIDGGAIAQTGTPEEIWRSPANSFVARFIGYRTTIPVEVRGGVAAAGALGRIPAPGRPDCSAVLVVPPDSVEIGDSGSLEGVVATATFQGAVYRLGLEVGNLVVETYSPAAPQVGAGVRLSLNPDRLIYLDE